MENPITMDDLGVPLFLETLILSIVVNGSLGNRLKLIMLLCYILFLTKLVKNTVTVGVMGDLHSHLKKKRLEPNNQQI